MSLPAQSGYSPLPVTTSMGLRPVPPVPLAPRPRGLWKGRGTLPISAASYPRSYDKRKSTPALTVDDNNNTSSEDDDDARSEYSSGSRKRRRVHTPDSPPTSEDSSSILYWDYSRKCSPANPERLEKWTTRTKLMDTSATTGPGIDRGPSCDLEDWEDLKELFAKAAEMYDSQEPAETIPMLRGVIHECHRFFKFYEDPSVLYAPPPQPDKSQAKTTPPEERILREWTSERDRPPLYPPRSAQKAGQGTQTDSTPPTTSYSSEPEKKCKCKDLPTAFHTIFGATLFFFGNLIAQDPALALPGEPAHPTPYWLAALDVFDIGENLPMKITGRGCPSAPEDWRMAIVWGRTLVCIADEVLSRQKQQQDQGLPQAPSSPSWPPANIPFPSPQMPTPIDPSSPGTADEPAWPAESPFALIVARRPPASRRLSLASVTPQDLLLLAQDQFSRGIFHMPHPQRGAAQSGRYPRALRGLGGLVTPQAGPSSSSKSSKHATPMGKPHPLPLSSNPSTSPTAPTSASMPPTTFSRPKELYTIAAELLLISEKLFLASERAEWAQRADGVFSQMQMEVEVPDVDDAWKGLIFAARGRCKLVMGSARAEGVEEAMEREDSGGGVLAGEEAQEAREDLTDAVEFLDKARSVLRDRRERAALGKDGKARERERDGEGNVLMLSADDVEDVELPAEGALEGDFSVVCPSGTHAHHEGDAEDRELRTLLAEALVTLANLTPNEGEREALYARAKAEGGGAVVLDDEEDAMDVCG